MTASETPDGEALARATGSRFDRHLARILEQLSVLEAQSDADLDLVVLRDLMLDIAELQVLVAAAVDRGRGLVARAGVPVPAYDLARTEAT